jgi:hypothetical protein
LFEFWHAEAEQAYRGQPWDACIAQHLLQHAPRMLVPLRQALGSNGRAVIATWPPWSYQCPAYDFLYSAAGEGVKSIGMPIAALRQQLQQARFQIVAEVKAKLRTPSITPADFLQQYLEGKQQKPPNADDLVKATRNQCDDLTQFTIAMNVIVVTAE